MIAGTKVFDAYSRYYDLIYGDKDYESEVRYIDSLLRKYGVAGRSLLEFGSGTGKHGRLFAGLGYQVAGIERSPEMVDQIAAMNGFTCWQGDICTVQLGRTYDAVISLFHVISYQISNENVLAAFSRAADHLLPGGLFIFDVWYSPAVYAQQPEVRIKRFADDEVEITRIAEPISYPNENRIDVNYTIHAVNRISPEFRVINETHPMRHFSLPELDLIAGQSGFECLTAEEFLTGREPGIDTWGVCLVFQRQGGG